MNRAVARAAGFGQARTIRLGNAPRVEQERDRSHIFPARQQCADVVEIGERRRVQDAIGVKVQDLVDVGGGGDADGLAPDQSPDVDSVLLVGIHPCAGDFEVRSMVDDRGQQFGAHRTRRPLDHA